MSLVPVTSDKRTPYSRGHRVASSYHSGPACTIGTMLFSQRRALKRIIQSLQYFSGPYMSPTWVRLYSGSRPHPMWSRWSRRVKWCSRIVGTFFYDKTITVNRNGMASLSFHAYGNQTRFPDKSEQFQTTFTGPGDEKHSIAVLFVCRKSTTHLMAWEVKLRSHFALFNPSRLFIWSSVACRDGPQPQLGDVPQSPRGRQLPKSPRGPSCLQSARRRSTCHKTSWWIREPSSCLFFRLRTQSILEDQRGILVEVHSFVHNQRVATERSWGAEYLLGCSVEDLFVDPDYYGYCHGMSICLWILLLL